MKPLDTLFAFPNGLSNEHCNDGMTLRDYFAGQALVGLLASSTALPWDEIIATRAAARAYIIADAMLSEREK